MGSSEMMIAESNRNEAKEAIELIGKVQVFLVDRDCYAAAEDLENAIQLIKKFSEKHQPDARRFK